MARWCHCREGETEIPRADSQIPFVWAACYRYQLKKKLNLFKLTPFMVNSVLAEGKGGFIRAKLVCKTLENFFASADEELTIDHVPIWCRNSQGQRVMVEQSEKLVSI